jgi:hypothetical protein
MTLIEAVEYTVMILDDVCRCSDTNVHILKYITFVLNFSEPL